MAEAGTEEDAIVVVGTAAAGTGEGGAAALKPAVEAADGSAALVKT